MTTGPAGISLIEEFEGCRLTAYQDGAGVWTIGYGHTHGVKPGDTCTEDEAREYLAYDLESAQSWVTKLVTVPLTQSQFDALVSFTYNLGAGSLRSSTLLKLVNAGSYALAAQEFAKWDKVAGKESPGLLRRREAERDLFLE
jgi:lysozyme